MPEHCTVFRRARDTGICHWDVVAYRDERPVAWICVRCGRLKQ